MRDGIYTLNEARDILGLNPVDGGDEPMFLTQHGPILLRDAGALEPRAADGIKPIDPL